MDPKQIVHSDPEILGGTAVFVGTRVPVDALIDFLEGGDTIEDLPRELSRRLAGTGFRVSRRFPKLLK